MEETKTGWGKPTLSKKWHYFTHDGRSLCFKWGFYTGPVEQGYDESPDNCMQCRKQLVKRQGK